MNIASRSNQSLLRLLAIGDIAAFVPWAFFGRLSHNLADAMLLNVVRIITPFLIGWFVATLLARPYDLALLRRPAAFIGRSVAAWLIAVAVGLFLRATLFGEGFVPVFAAVTLGATGVLLLGWRAFFIWRWRDGV